jgi:DNA-binding transcriptional MerR regulator
MKTIHEVAALAGVPTSTLRYYDEIGLLKPRVRSNGGYRLYGSEEVLRLREIVIWRELGFPLAEIARLVDDPEGDRVAALDRQLKLAGAHLDRLRRIIAGLENAIGTIRRGQSLTEEEIFAGFALSAGNGDHRSGVRPGAGSGETKRVSTFGFLNDHARAATRNRLDDEEQLPARICVTDPIRLAEALLALGILPVGAGTYEDRFTKQPGAWPWSPLIERSVRGRIRDVGYYGSDVRQIESLRPDLIFDLFWPSTGINLAQHLSEGRFDLDALSNVAQTRLIDIDPGTVPAFTTRLPQVAEALGCVSEAESLLAIWAARTYVLRAHLQGIEVSALSCWNDELFSPTSRHPGQVLTSVGLVLTPPRGRESPDGYHVFFEEDAIPDLDAATLFLNTRYLGRDDVNGLLSGKLAKHVSAVRTGRVIDFGMEIVNSGWFGAHWQLQVIARAYGLVLLRAGQDADAIFAAINPSNGLLSIAAPQADGALVLGGPYLAAQSVVVERERATTLQLDRVCAAHLAQVPEMYTAARADGADLAFTADRESALERIAGRSVRRARAPRAPARERGPQHSLPARQPHYT